jgi:hypothetical protein
VGGHGTRKKTTRKGWTEGRIEGAGGGCEQTAATCTCRDDHTTHVHRGTRDISTGTARKHCRGGHVHCPRGARWARRWRACQGTGGGAGTRIHREQRGPNCPCSPPTRAPRGHGSLTRPQEATEVKRGGEQRDGVGRGTAGTRIHSERTKRLTPPITAQVISFTTVHGPPPPTPKPPAGPLNPSLPSDTQDNHTWYAAAVGVVQKLQLHWVPVGRAEPTCVRVKGWEGHRKREREPPGMQNTHAQPS